MTDDYPTSRIVDTAYGKVQGRRLVYQGDRQVDAFQGIPFAAPPVGELRFRKPQPPSSWEGVKETKAFGPRAMQIPLTPKDNELYGIPFEDCLYLNVFTPCWEAPEGGFPVMVFIHGGAFFMGEASSYGDIGICENIVTRGVVFVTIHYRLGYLGFFSTGDAECPGNFGLWDQIEALKWVHQNIEAFGGNENNVTALGQSAGAGSVDLLHLSQHSTDLFHKAICMSGSAECRWAMHPDMRMQSLGLARKLGIDEKLNSAELLAKLRALSAEKFLVTDMDPSKEGNADFEAAPCLGDDLFPSSLESLRAKATPKPLLTGAMKEEGLIMMTGRQATPEGLEATLKEATLGSSRKEEMMSELKRRYIGDAKREDSAYIRGMAEMVSDSFFNSGTLELCRKTVELQREPVYFYVFEHYNPASMELLEEKFGGTLPVDEATHSSEFFYLFKTSYFGKPELTEQERRIMDTFTRAFTNFAKYGNPNGADDSETDLPTRWEPITQDNPSLNYVIPSGEPHMRELFFQGRTADFIEIRNRYN